MSSYNNGYGEIYNMDYKAGELQIGTTPVLACVNGTSNMPERKNIIIYNRSSETIWLGPSGVTTTSKGIPIAPETTSTFNVGVFINVYLIASSANNVVTIQEIG